MLKIIKKDKTSGKSAIIEIDEDGREVVVEAGLTEKEADTRLEALDDEGCDYAKDG